jgi:flavin-dependent dehydrogenase
VIGGGLAGSVFAISLAKKGYKIVLVEKSDLSKYKAGESLSPECKRYLHKLGLNLSELPAHEYYGNDSAWGSDKIEEHNFIFNPFGSGISIDRNVFEQKVIENALTQGVEVYLNTKTNSIKRVRNRFVTVFENNDQTVVLTTSLVVYATGRANPSQTSLGDKRFFDHLIALSWIKQENKKLSNHLLIESCRNGWFYTNRLPGEKRVHTFFTDSNLINSDGGKRNFLIKQLKGTIWGTSYFDENSILTNDLYLSDARLYYSSNQCGNGWFSIGDTAYTVDPLCGQGILKILKQIDFWLENLNLFLNKPQEIGLEYSSYNYRNFNEHIKQRNYIYQLEKRWENHEFWKRRQKQIK